MSDPYTRGGMSVTLKADGKDGTWVVYHGTPEQIREQILATFEIEESKDAPLFDLINEATRIYKAAGNVSSGLGGRVVSSSKQADKPAGSAWEQASNAPAEPEVDPNVARLEGEIEGAASVDALKELYARNVAVFESNADLMDAWKAKGRALS